MPTRSTDNGVPALCRMVAAAAAGDATALALALGDVRSSGVSPIRVREALRLLVPYAGHPRALAAFSAAGLPPPDSAAEPDAAVEAEPAERARRGRAAFHAVYGPSAPRVLAGLAALDPLLPAWTLEHAYGRVLARDGLSLTERELLGVSVLAALGGLPEPLLGHLRGARRLGASADDLWQALHAVPEALRAARLPEALAVLARVDVT